MGVQAMWKKATVAAGIAVVLVAGISAPALAGEHDWNSYTTNHYHASTYHKQERLANGTYKARTTHTGWANLRVQAKCTQAGTTFYTSEVVGSDFVVVYCDHMLQHRSEW